MTNQNNDENKEFFNILPIFHNEDRMCGAEYPIVIYFCILFILILFSHFLRLSLS